MAPPKPTATASSLTTGPSQKKEAWNPFAKATADTTSHESGPGAAHRSPVPGTGQGDGPENKAYYISTAPKINAPTGGGALKSIDEKFDVNPVSGTCSLSIPFEIPPGRNGLAPEVYLSYDSGSGNGPLGLGWTLSLPSISRKTSLGLPKYDDHAESDVFLFSGAEDLVPKLSPGASGAGSGLDANDANGENVAIPYLERQHGDWQVREYWPRTEGAFTRIERWFKSCGSPADTYWRTISRSNVTSFWGRTRNSKIVDETTGRVFAWLICETYDSRGDAILYTYAEENSVGVRTDQAHEMHRSESSRSTGRYIKSIKYGNVEPARDLKNWQTTPYSAAENGYSDRGWMFEVVFDYGDHQQQPKAKPDAPWPTRKDPFSTYTTGFEVRTYRLCHRILLFHHFPDELVQSDYLVRSLELSYVESETVSMLSKATQYGHALEDSGTPVKSPLPPIELEYSTADLRTSPTIQSVPQSAFQNLPAGLSPPVQWVDLDGTGKSSALCVGTTGEGEGWFQMSNLSRYEADYHNPQAGTAEVLFGPPQHLSAIPNAAGSSTSLLDLDGSGRLSVVVTGAQTGQRPGPGSTHPQPGFYERTDECGWTDFMAFPSWPTVASAQNANLRYLDLTGNGIADIIISEADSFVWYPALGTSGFGEATRTFAGEAETGSDSDPPEGPRLLFSDGLETIYQADFSGDGLADLVRIRNGDICYWPNLGYGHFGAKIVMDNAPWMDPYDRYNSNNRIQLADIDGSGVADILYFPPEGGLRIYLNLAGNGWSDAVEAPSFPLLDSLAHVNVLDLFGSGVSSLVWSTTSPSAGGASSSLQFLDFTHGLKPHLLVKYRNGPAETRVHYRPSTSYRQDDDLAGRAWPTRLPFPVQCVSRIEKYDCLSRFFTAASHTYHDGYFDGFEREFRGFGKVETVNTEYFLLERVPGLPITGGNGEGCFPSSSPAELERSLRSSPPTKHVAWFHTGAYHKAPATAESVRSLYKKEYYRIKGIESREDEDALVGSLKSLDLPSSIGPIEARQAHRALKGGTLHEETYLLDGSLRENIPFTVSDNRQQVRMLQRAVGDNRRHQAVFLVHVAESLTCQLERDEADPRIGHELVLELDTFGNATKSVNISYGRRASSKTGTHSVEDWEAQSATVVRYSENELTNAITELADDYLAPLPAESRSYEVRGLVPSGGRTLFAWEELDPATVIKKLPAKKYTDQSSSAGLRLLSRTQTRYRANNFAAELLAPGVVESLAIPGESYNLVISSDVARVLEESPLLLPSSSAATDNSSLPLAFLGGKGDSDGGFVDLESDGSWWVPSGQQRMSSKPPLENITPEMELAAARASFFQPAAYIDPFGSRTEVVLDKYFMHPMAVIDALGNRSSSVVDYRTLQPKLVTDANGNRTAAAFDAFGRCVGIAVMGKEEAPLGDSLAGFQPFREADALQELVKQDPLDHVASVLGSCSSVAFASFPSPPSTASDHRWSAAFNISVVKSTVGPFSSLFDLQVAVSYFDGSGKSLQTRTLCSTEPGPEQWVVSSCTAANGSGVTIRQWDAFFSDTHAFGLPPSSIGNADEPAGYSTTFCDPAGRAIASLLPNHTWTKLIYSPWKQASWDPGDTVLLGDPLADPDVGPYLAGLDETSAAVIQLPKWSWYARRSDPAADDMVRRTAEACATTYAATPAETWLDVMGQPFLTIADNGPEGQHINRSYHDAQGRVVKVVDAEDRIVALTTYDLAGSPISFNSLDSGLKWQLNDATGQRIRSWDSRGVYDRACHDSLRRPVHWYVQTTEAGGSLGPETISAAMMYGDGLPDAAARNLCGRVYQIRDQALVTTITAYNHLGGAVEGTEQLVKEYREEVDWSGGIGSVALEDEVFAWSATFDALGRPISKTKTDGSVVVNSWNQLGQLASVHTSGVPGSSSTSTSSGSSATTTAVIQEIKHNARGQRTLVVYGNGTQTQSHYDKDTFLLTSRTTIAQRPRGQDQQERAVVLQDLHYSMDCLGKIVRIDDSSQQDVFFRGDVVSPTREYSYDAIGRLIRATGREHLGQAQGQDSGASSHGSEPSRQLSPSDGKAMTRYTEQYRYSKEGNILSVAHARSDPSVPGYTRTYQYEEPSLLEPGKKKNNRLSSTTVSRAVYPCRYEGLDGLAGLVTSMAVGGDGGGGSGAYTLRYDTHHRLMASSRQVVGDGATPETTWYRYDWNNKRRRKVTDGYAPAGQEPVKTKDHAYLDSDLDVFRKFGRVSESVSPSGAAPNVISERWSWHVYGGSEASSSRTLLVEAKRIITSADDDETTASGINKEQNVFLFERPVMRYQLSSDLTSSVSLELDDEGNVISMEEYSPYGTTTYDAVSSPLLQVDKRYRYAAKERDSETGLCYFERRYFIPGLGRWLTPDPLAVAAGLNVYLYCGADPINSADPSGLCPFKLQYAIPDPRLPTGGYTINAIRSINDRVVFSETRYNHPSAIPSVVRMLQESNVRPLFDYLGTQTDFKSQNPDTGEWGQKPLQPLLMSAVGHRPGERGMPSEHWQFQADWGTNRPPIHAEHAKQNVLRSEGYDYAEFDGFLMAQFPCLDGSFQGGRKGGCVETFGDRSFWRPNAAFARITAFQLKIEDMQTPSAVTTLHWLIKKKGLSPADFRRGLTFAFPRHLLQAEAQAQGQDPGLWGPRAGGSSAWLYHLRGISNLAGLPQRMTREMIMASTRARCAPASDEGLPKTR